MNIFQFISVQVLHKRIREGGEVKVAADMLTRGGGGGQNFGKSAYVILEQSLNKDWESTAQICTKKLSFLFTSKHFNSLSCVQTFIVVNIADKNYNWENKLCCKTNKDTKTLKN